ncbi:hypothetical protein V6R21_01355 [Limibacter armeniacum]|uniref:hypothetical protein n=1 Tax=Limibacter armeniacum TaxID=466084 RepID=UPI002FE5FEFB
MKRYMMLEGNRRKIIIIAVMFIIFVVIVRETISYKTISRQPPFIQEDYDSLILDGNILKNIGGIKNGKLFYKDFTKIIESRADTTSYKIVLYGEHKTLEYNVKLFKVRQYEWKKLDVSILVK